MAIITTGKTISKGIPGGEGIPMRNGPNRRMATMIQNMTMEPWPHTSGCLISQRRLMKWEEMSNGAMV